MIRWTPTRSASPPQRWQSREDILKAHLDSLSPDELLRRRPDFWAIRFGQGAARRYDEYKYEPSQPRDDRGRWVEAGGKQTSDDTLVKRILVRAPQLAASSTPMSRCLDICSPLLERFQPAGSDRNQFDFRKCLNACLGRLGR